MKNDLEISQELFDFLQGEIPKDITIPKNKVPNLTADQAWVVVWYLGNLYRQINDDIERCDVCGSLYNTCEEGDTLDYGKSPHYFCDGCMYSNEYETKEKAKKTN